MPGGSRNRKAGHGFERELAKVFRDLGFPYIVTSRSESKSRDDQKVDLINKDEYKNGRFPYNVQAKNTKGHLAYGKLMAEIPSLSGVINVIIHNQTEKVGERFITRDQFAILRLEDFLTLVKERHERKATGAVMVSKAKRGDGKRILPEPSTNSKDGIQPVQGIPQT